MNFDKIEFERIGLIFDPNKYDSIGEYAQSPQTVEFNDFVRIYFSTRYRDKEEKYISFVAYIDMSKNLDKILSVSNHQIISKGNLGCYDEHGIFPFNVVKDDKNILGFIGGWSRRISVDVETSIGLSISNDDGKTFTRIGDGPVLSSSLNEPFMVGDPFVIKTEGKFDMWYIYGTKWITNPKNKIKERVYKIGHATSKNAINWVKTDKQLISDVLGENECQALPSVLFHNKYYHMVFCFREAMDFREKSEAGYRLGYAISEDGINWKRFDKKLIFKGEQLDWDLEMKCYPHLTKINDEIYLLYNGNCFGKNGFGLAKLIS
jgi:predicted GH43/DUF377 family glycosyl hydrolase